MSSCPGCSDTPTEKVRGQKYNRGLQSVTADSHYLECRRCLDDTERPLRWTDTVLDAKNLELANVAWKSAFGTVMPPSRFDTQRVRKR